MQRALAATALMLLYCTACATVEKVPTDARLLEARKAFDESTRLRAAEQYTEAVPLAERALQLREAVLGGAHPEVASCLNLLGDVHRLRGDHARAGPLLQRALAIRETALGKEHPDVATSLHNLALLHQEQGRSEQAEPLYERALAIRQATLGKNHSDLAHTLNNLANVYLELGKYAHSESLHKRALAIREEAFGQNAPRVAYSLHNLANVYKRQGYYALAEPLIQRSLTILEKAFGETHPHVARSLINLASVYEYQGDYARVESLLQRALAIQEAILDKNHPDVGISLNNLASTYQALGHYARAEPLYQRSIAIAEATLGTEHPEVALSLSNLAINVQAQGRYEQAESLNERALAIGEVALTKEHANLAILLTNLASTYQAQGRYALAKPLHERALSIREAVLGRNHPHIALSLNYLAQLRLAQQRLEEALPLFERAFTISEEHLRQEVFSFSETRLASALRLLRIEEERIYTLVRAHHDNARVRGLAVSAALLRKGRSVEEISDTSRVIYRGLRQADRETFERLRALRTQFATLSLAGPGQLSPADYQQRLKELADQGDTLEADLARRSATLRILHARPPPGELIDHVTKALPGDGVLVEFVAYNDSPLVPQPGSENSSELRYLALLLFPDGRTHALDLGPAAPIDHAALRLHDALARRSVAYQTAAQKLHALVFRPLAPLLGKVRRLFLSPDGQLALVPFAALHDGRHFLVDSFDITYLTSGKDLLPRPEDISLARSVVVLADPDFSAPVAPFPLAHSSPPLAERSASLEHFFSTSRALSEQLWPPVPGTRKEAEAIQHLLPHAQLFLGSAATKDTLLKLATPGVLHIATHGFFFEDAPTPRDTRAVAHLDVSSLTGPRHRPPDPLLRSGLVLTGARAPEAQSGSRRPEDSLVTALELAGLNLWGTQLVVLSACDTGRGDIKLGQGVYGLRRALVVAGAETLVTSLWKVNDDTTREFMEGYYRNLLAGQGRTAALRETMRAMRRKQPHPYFWAPFIAIGQDAPLRELTPASALTPASGSGR